MVQHSTIDHTGITGVGLTDHNHTSAGGDGGDLDAPVIDGYAIFNEESAPSTPSAGTVAVYAKSDGRLYSKDDAGVESGPFSSGGGGVSAFPQIGTVAATSITSNGTSHVVTLPATITAGTLLLIVAGIDGTATISASGWTALSGFAAQSTGNCSIGALWKIASGSEGASVTVTSSASEKAEYYAMQISNNHASAPIEGAGFQTASAGSAQDPPSLTPSWGSDDDLWLAMAISDTSGDATLAYIRQPLLSCYKYSVAPGVTDSVAMAIVYREYTGTVWDPQAFVASNSEQFCSGTIAIRTA